MKLTTLVRRELFERKSQLMTSLLAITLGITAMVAVRNLTVFSERAVARELDALGANILILPKSTSLSDYYTADMHGEEFPEEYVTRLATSGIEGIDNLSPKLSGQIDVTGKKVTLTGILPKSEFQAKLAWQGAGIFARPQGCGGTLDVAGRAAAPTQETLVRKRVIETLADDEALVGADVASRLSIQDGQTLDILGKRFKVVARLPQTGTVDDSRVFAHLHAVQKLLGKGRVLNAIEIVGCCEQISKGLVQKINSLLPDAKVVTIAQIVDTQLRTNQMMSGLSVVFLVIIVLVGGASIANSMYANVFERRREIGTLMALGAGSSMISRMFLIKAFVLGAAGGVGGYVLGSVAAIVLGPWIAGVPVTPLAMLAPSALTVGVVVSLAASYFPARRAAGTDPSVALQEA